MANWFKPTPSQYYLEINVPKPDSANSNIICCVDISGSMGGAPIKNVCTVLRDIYLKTKVAYPLFLYNTAVRRTTIQEVEKTDLQANGGTSFACIFDAIKAHLVSNVKPTTFIFMTDGQDTGSDPKGLAKSVEMLKLVISGMKGVSIAIHTIGFGDVNNDFLNNKVRKFGNKEGLFKYASESAELQNSFNDMFEFASSSREFTVFIGSKNYTAYSTDETVALLVDDVQLEDIKEVKLTYDAGKSSLVAPLTQLLSVRPIHQLKALNLISPDNEEKVREILTQVNAVQRTGTDFMEKLEVEQLKKEISDRMMEYISLFTQIKMGQVPEQVKLKLSALRHEATFANLQRKKKLDLRVNKNVEYFKKTDISGILEGYKTDLDKRPEVWEEIKVMSGEWVCSLSKRNLFQLMKEAPDNVLCIGLLVERDESAIDSPTKGLKLLNVSTTFVSFDDFIAAMNAAKQSATEAGDFAGVSNATCCIGDGKERINAVVPLYIHHEHMKRIRILEGLWLGHLFTLDSYGYDKNQEIGLIKLLHDIIVMRTATESNMKVIHEIEKVCKFIINESVGFKSAYGSNTYDQFVSSASGRNSVFDLCIPLMIGYLKEEIHKVVIPVYYEHIKNHLKQTHKNADTTDLVKRLIYGQEVTTLVAPPERDSLQNMDNPDYVEETFIRYFNDEQQAPVKLIPETRDKARKAVMDVDPKFVLSLVPPVPELIKEMLLFASVEPDFVERNIDPDDVRKEILIMLHFDTCPSHIMKQNIINFVDTKIQGNSTDVVKFDLHPDNVKIVCYKMVTAKTLAGFGGLMRKYCSNRCGAIFHAAVTRLLCPTDGEVVLAKEKLTALLTNSINYQPFYVNFYDICWQPLVKKCDLEKIVPIEEIEKIEQENIRSGKRVVHVYRLSNILNRHGHGNFNPNMNNLFPFSGYDNKI